MFFKKYDLYENKLSEQLQDDNPYKKKLIQMETPTEKHPIYTGLVWGLLIYSWIFFIVLCYKQINQSVLYNLKIAISAESIIFVSFSIWICYKKDYLIGVNPKYRRNSYIIFALSVVFSVLIEGIDSGNATKTEILETFCFFYTTNSKSYVALAIVSYIALGIASSYYTCPYELYRGFYSINQTYKEYPCEKTLLNKWFLICIIAFFIYIPVIYIAFNPANDSFSSKIKFFSITGIFSIIPFCSAIFWGQKYYRYYSKAINIERSR